jgi:hypothetical protein
MTASGFSTGSTIGQPRPPDRERGGSPQRKPERPSVAAIVASLHGRTGKSLLARVLADYFILSGWRPLLFDTDSAERTLHAAFPYDTVVVDPADTRDQMTLFDTLAARSPESRVVDVSHHVQRKFFKVMFESDFVAEARARQVEPVIFTIMDRNADAWEAARLMRERFPDCALVLVENAFLGKVKELTRRSAGYRALEAHDPRMSLPLLDRAIADAIEEPNISLSDLMNRPLSRTGSAGSVISFERQAELRGWLMKVFRDIHRVTREVEARAQPLVPAEPVI